MTDLLGHGRFEIGDEHCRFILIERWGDAPLLGYVGMNPSYAGAQRTDPSFTRFNGFARRWGFGGTIWGNLVPYRSAQPKDALKLLRDALDGRDYWARDQLWANQTHLERHAGKAQHWVCGWGAGGGAMEALNPSLISTVIESIEQGLPTTFLAFGLTAGRDPKHVLARGAHRIPDDAPVYRFDPFMWSLGDEIPMPLRAAA